MTLQVIGFEDNRVKVKYDDGSDEFWIPSRKPGSRRAVYMRYHRRELRERGRCTRCGYPATGMYSTCKKCRDEFCAMRERLKSEGRCVCCGTGLDEGSVDEGTTDCTACKTLRTLRKRYD